ncbi:S-layer homology domain-containing protein [Paenibacillus sp. YSY-4.3]
MGNTYAAKQRFTDVPSNHWASPAIEYLADSKLMGGYSDGTFKPNAYITQEEFIVTAVSIVLGRPAGTASQEDSTSEEWSDWAYDVLDQKGIYSYDDYWVSGGDKRKVHITRADAARIIYLLLNGNVEHLSTKKAVQYLYQKGMTSGSYNNRGDFFANYGPAELLTRAYTAVLLKGVKDSKEGKIKRPSSATPLKDTLASRIKNVAQKANVKVTATTNGERYQTEVKGSGIHLDFQLDDFAYADLGEHWHMTIIALDKSKINLMASILVELGLPMSEKDARSLLKDLLALKYGQVGKTYEKGKTAIHTSYYFGHHIQWGEQRNNSPEVVSNADPYALFVNGVLKRAPGFNTFLDPVFAENGIVYVPVNDILRDMGGSYTLDDDWTTSILNMGGNVRWQFEWDGVPKKKGSPIYVGTRIGNHPDNHTVSAIMEGGTLFVPLEFIAEYYPVNKQMENKTQMIFVGTFPEHPTANYFGTKGQYPSTFDFNPLDPNAKYPGGWKAPQLKAKWSPDPQKNFQAFAAELGFTNEGRTFGITGASRAITLIGGDDNGTEITLQFTGWGTPPGQPDATLSESFKIPVVSAQLFHFYFEEKWKTVWNYFNRNDIPEQFKLNGRMVKVSYDHLTGILTMKIGKKSS